jgi:hypothetical protein
VTRATALCQPWACLPRVMGMLYMRCRDSPGGVPGTWLADLCPAGSMVSALCRDRALWGDMGAQSRPKERGRVALGDRRKAS